MMAPKIVRILNPAEGDAVSAWRNLLAAACIFAFAACDAPAPPPVTLRVGVFPVQSFLPYYVMREQGLDAKHGLRFEETPVSGGAAVIEALAERRLDVSPVIATVPLMRAAERGLVPAKLVAVVPANFADAAHPGVGVIVANGVNGWRDLEGRRIGVNARSSISAAAGEMRLDREGVRGYSFVEIDFANLGLALAGGNVAAVLMDEPYLTQSLLRGDGKLLGWVMGGAPLERTMFSSVVFSAEFLRRNPGAVKGYLRAHLAAVRWINANPDQARQVLARRMNLTPEVAKQIHLLHWPEHPSVEPMLLEQLQHLLVRAGLLKQGVDINALHDETLLAEVLKEKR